jgi:hypothetical protein
MTLTRQEIFNKVWQHAVIEQQPPSITYENQCRYRGPDGTKCFIGVIIPDEKYDPSFEKSSLRHILEVLNFDVELSPFLRSLQCIHDSCARYDEKYYFQNVKLRLTEFSYKESLQIPA